MKNIVFTIVSKQQEQIQVCEIQEKDAWAICDFIIANEDRLKRYFPKTLAQNLNPELAQYFAVKKAKQFRNNEEFLFVLKEASNRKVIGLVYIKELHKVLGQGEFAYCVDYNFEGHGIITKAVAKLSDYSFKELALNRLQIIAHKNNTSSVKVAEHCGFTWQKTLKSHFTPPNSNPLDMELYERYK